MQLIGPESDLPDAVLLSMYEGHREGIAQILATMEKPAFSVTDPARLAMARSFGRNVLALLEDRPIPAGRESLRRRVNLTYETLLILIDYTKYATSAPKVPTGKSRAPATSDRPAP